MYPDASDNAAELVDLAEIVGAISPELLCLLGPSIQLATGSLPEGGAPVVRARRDELVDLLRHLAIDARDAMAAGGRVTIRTGRLREVAASAAMVIHEAPEAGALHDDEAKARIRKGRSLGLGASYDLIERVGGHFHVSCRGRDTVLTICFPLAE